MNTDTMEMNMDELEELRKRVAELEAKNLWLMNDAEEVQRAIDTAWNDAIRAAVKELRDRERFTSAGVIWTLLRNEGGSDGG